MTRRTPHNSMRRFTEPARPARRRPPHRRGSAYALVLLVATLVMVVGLAGIQATRLQTRMTEREADAVAARHLAVSAIDLGILAMEQSPTGWRTDFQLGIMPTNRPMGRGALSLEAMDPVDGDIANNNTDPVVLTGTGTVGAARHMVEVRVEFPGSNPRFTTGSWTQAVD